MKNGMTNRTSMTMVSPTADDLKAIHSIEAILGIKNLHHHHQQPLYPPHLLPLEKFEQKKRHSHEPSSKSK